VSYDTTLGLLRTLGVLLSIRHPVACVGSPHLPSAGAPLFSSPVLGTAMPPDRPLAAASRRLRRPPGRPPGLAGSPIDGAPPVPAKDAAPGAVFATSLPPRGLSVPLAARYSGLSVRGLWRLIRAGRLPVIRVAGTRRVLIDRVDLDRLLDAAKDGPEAVKKRSG
jgi:excisionase family DNA binding protein